MEYIDLDFIKPNKDCDICDHINDYVCFDCESIQVKEKYPNAKWELPDWIVNETVPYNDIMEANNDK
jgi:hypothetical protein